MQKEDNYYRILEFLDKKVESNELLLDDVKSFKEVIRDNKYVSTYIRSLKKKMENYKSIDDFIKAMDKHEKSKNFKDVVEYEVRQILDSIWNYEPGKDPIKMIHYIIDSAIEREGKICDFKDSANPDKKFGRCENDEHYEVTADDSLEYLTKEQRKEFDNISENSKYGEDDAYGKFQDIFHPVEELELTLGQDCEINKFVDSDTYYICEKCMQKVKDYGECEVSCDME